MICSIYHIGGVFKSNTQHTGFIWLSHKCLWQAKEVKRDSTLIIGWGWPFPGMLLHKHWVQAAGTRCTACITLHNEIYPTKSVTTTTTNSNNIRWCIKNKSLIHNNEIYESMSYYVYESASFINSFIQLASLPKGYLSTAFNCTPVGTYIREVLN